MKKLAALLSMMIWIDIAAAQSTTATTGTFASYFSAGPRIGINFSNISGTDNAESKTGLLAGAFLIYSFQEHFGAGLDVLYSMEGAEYTETAITNGMVVRSAVKDRLNYLRIPVQANVFFCDYGKPFRPKVSLGPVIGFLLNAERKSQLTIEDGAVTTLESSSRDVKDAYSATDIGAIAGAGFNLRMMEETWFNFDVRYYIGATDIRDVRPAGSDERKNNALSISAGVAFGF
jgi:hypothetical protein